MDATANQSLNATIQRTSRSSLTWLTSLHFQMEMLIGIVTEEMVGRSFHGRTKSLTRMLTMDMSIGKT